VTNKLQRVLSAAARVVTNSRKYDRDLTYARRHELHWLDVPERIQFRVAATVHRCLLSKGFVASVPLRTMHTTSTESVKTSPPVCRCVKPAQSFYAQFCSLSKRILHNGR